MIARNWLSLVQKNYHYSEICAIIPLTYLCEFFNSVLAGHELQFVGSFFYLILKYVLYLFTYLRISNIYFFVKTFFITKFCQISKKSL